MAVFSGVIESKVMDLETNLVVILPYDEPVENQRYPSKVLYLLHGLSNNAYAWTRYTSIERYAKKHGYTVIMPEVNRSFYLDMEYGLPYFTYISEELPALCRKLFHISEHREDTYIAGLSMGGYGAMKCALNFPERYAGAASFSGALDLESILQLRTAFPEQTKELNELRAALGPDFILKDEDNLMTLAEELTAVSPTERPELFITCGKQDALYSQSKSFTQQLDRLIIDYVFHDWDGEHEWGFWDKSVDMALDFFEGKVYEV